MAHSYLGDGNRVHGEFDPDRGDERGRNRREPDWRARDEGWRGTDRDRGRMFGGWDRASNEGRSSDRSWQGEYDEGRRNFSTNPDDHYRSWRDRHMSELDRDYEDFCRERERQFHSDFNAWRRERHSSVQPLRTGMTQSGLSADPTGLAQAEAETSPASPDVEDPMASATQGTTPRGRGRS
ncbi:MAG TPA: hypothetical protein VHU79_00310 [Sphingomicrobium sp.]|jgi:hypothetical protein|nr:hypothetical protein [Sphingomicrobium sp.]